MRKHFYAVCVLALATTVGAKPKIKESVTYSKSWEAAVAEAKHLSWPKLYLYCSGTLPDYYKNLGWHRTEALDYQGKTRIIMEIAT